MKVTVFNGSPAGCNCATNVLLRFAVPDVKTLDALVGRIKTFGDSRTSIEL